MDFIFNHGGFLISVGVIMLLALIGYYADRNETKKKLDGSSSSNGKDSLIEKRDDDVSKDDDVISDDLNDVVLSQDMSDYNSVVSFDDGVDINSGNEDNAGLSYYSDDLNSDNGVKSDDLSLDSATDNDYLVSDDIGKNFDENSSFSSSNYEDINMSLQDLEKKSIADGNTDVVSSQDMSDSLDGSNDDGVDDVGLMNYIYDNEVESDNLGSESFIDDSNSDDESIDSSSDLLDNELDDVWKF